MWLGAAVYALVLTFESITDHDDFRTGLDTAASDQLLWLLAHGEEPFSTVFTRPFLGIHFQPGLAVLTPLYWVDLDVSGAFAAQSIALALTAPALYALARECGASPALAAVPAFLWLVCPAVASINLFEFRAESFAPVFIVLSVLFALQGRNVLLGATMLVALSMKEDIALTYAVLGVVLVYTGRRRVGTVVAVASVIWLAVASTAIRSQAESYEAFERRWAGDRGDTIAEAVRWTLTHPLETVGDIGSQSLPVLLALLVSTAGLALLAPTWIVLGAPSALINVLSAYPPSHALDYHYHLGAMVGLFVAAAIGVHRLSAVGRAGRLAASAGITAALILAVFAGARVHDVPEVSRVDADDARRAIDRVPPDAPVAATSSLLPHVSRRVEAYTLPEPFLQIDWGSSLFPTELEGRARRVRFVVYAEGDQLRSYYTGRHGRERAVADVRPTLREHGFVEVARFGTIQVFERP